MGNSGIVRTWERKLIAHRTCDQIYYQARNLVSKQHVNVYLDSYVQMLLDAFTSASL